VVVRLIQTAAIQYYQQLPLQVVVEVVGLLVAG
jgi:hypothetical protein